MTREFTFLLIGFGVAALLAAGVGTAVMLRSIMQRLDSLEESIRQISAGTRHTHSTNAGIEDAIMALGRWRMENELNQAWYDRAVEILRSMQEGPKAYDPNTPTGDTVCGRQRWRWQPAEDGNGGKKSKQQKAGNAR